MAASENNSPARVLPRLIVLRHSERLDEADPALWERIINTEYPPTLVKNNHKNLISAKSSGAKVTSASVTISKRDIRCFGNDPPLAEPVGLQKAEDASETLMKMLAPGSASVSTPNSIFRLFSSRMQRTIQTAIPLARKLNVPIILSAGISQILAIMKRGGP
jgi:hypothetical protein